MVSIVLPPRTGGTDSVVTVPTTGGGAASEASFPRAVGPAGAGVAPGGAMGQILVKTATTNYATGWADNVAAIPYGLPGALTAPLSILLTFPITLQAALCAATGTGTGSVTFDLDGAPVASVSLPSGVITLLQPALTAGLLTLTSSGTLSDVYITLAGAK